MYPTKSEKKSILYVSTFISLIFNFPKIVRIYGETDLAPSYPWDFNLYELIFQILFQILFCYLLGYIALKRIQNNLSNNLFEIKIILAFIVTTFVIWFIGSNLQEIIFKNVSNQKFFYRTYLIRFTLSSILMFVTSKLLLLNRQKSLGELENEKLKSSYLKSKLENLKDQINPHFLFNSFANLSALINEDQHKAKKYLSNLSDVFRYTLNNSNEQIVDLIDELALLNSYIKLYKIRVQDGLSLQIDLPNKQKKILNMSLQPLMENVIKHNEISEEKPLSICLKQKGDLLTFENNLNPKKMSENSNGIGLSNLNERYKILVGKEINIQKNETHFIVTLPLI